MGGLVHSMDQPSVYRASSEGLWLSDNLVSASLFVRLSVTLVTKAYQTEKTSDDTLAGSFDVMCRGSNVKDKRVSAFQLESLILAQNERWRHA